MTILELNAPGAATRNFRSEIEIVWNRRREVEEHLLAIIVDWVHQQARSKGLGPREREKLLAQISVHVGHARHWEASYDWFIEQAVANFRTFGLDP